MGKVNRVKEKLEMEAAKVEVLKEIRASNEKL